MRITTLVNALTAMVFTYAERLRRTASRDE